MIEPIDDPVTDNQGRTPEQKDFALKIIFISIIGIILVIGYLFITK